MGDFHASSRNTTILSSFIIRRSVVDRRDLPCLLSLKEKSLLLFCVWVWLVVVVGKESLQRIRQPYDWIIISSFKKKRKQQRLKRVNKQQQCRNQKVRNLIETNPSWRDDNDNDDDDGRWLTTAWHFHVIPCRCLTHSYRWNIFLLQEKVVKTAEEEKEMEKKVNEN